MFVLHTLTIKLKDGTGTQQTIERYLPVAFKDKLCELILKGDAFDAGWTIVDSTLEFTHDMVVVD